MMKLPALTEAERAWIDQNVLVDLTKKRAQNIAERIRLQLQSRFGMRIDSVAIQVFSRVTEFRPAQPGVEAAQPGIESAQPEIQIDATLAAIWIGLRYGGKPSKLAHPHHAAWLYPLEQEVRRALAAAVVNQNGNEAWPQAMQVRLQIGQAQGTININLGREAPWSWAWQQIRAIPAGQRRGVQGNA